MRGLSLRPMAHRNIAQTTEPMEPYRPGLEEKQILRWCLAVGMLRGGGMDWTGHAPLCLGKEEKKPVSLETVAGPWRQGSRFFRSTKALGTPSRTCTGHGIYTSCHVRIQTTLLSAKGTVTLSKPWIEPPLPPVVFPKGELERKPVSLETVARISQLHRRSVLRLFAQARELQSFENNTSKPSKVPRLDAFQCLGTRSAASCCQHVVQKCMYVYMSVCLSVCLSVHRDRLWSRNAGNISDEAPTQAVAYRFLRCWCSRWLEFPCVPLKAERGKGFRFTQDQSFWKHSRFWR